MATSYGALCTDFYVNQTLAVKMDLPYDRETIMHLFDRVRKSRPEMDRFRRYDDELALESSRREDEYTWLAMRQNSVRTGHVNPESMEQAYAFHRMVLETVPFYLTISPLDIDYYELLFGYDLECQGNHDEVVYEALFSRGPIGDLLEEPLPGCNDGEGSGEGETGEVDGESAGEAGGESGGGRLIDVQPIFRATLNHTGDLQACFEVKTRERSRKGSASRTRDEPLSIYLSIRKFGPIDNVEELAPMIDELGRKCELLASERLIPHLLTPIARQITSSNA
jgi:hypothetical protein